MSGQCWDEEGTFVPGGQDGGTHRADTRAKNDGKLGRGSEDLRGGGVEMKVGFIDAGSVVGDAVDTRELQEHLDAQVSQPVSSDSISPASAMKTSLGRWTYLYSCSNHHAMEDSLAAHCENRLEGDIAGEVERQLNVANLPFDGVGVIVQEIEDVPRLRGSLHLHEPSG